MAKYSDISRTRAKKTEPQSVGLIQNAAGGTSYKVEDFARLRRFIVLGVEGNSYYEDQVDLVKQNVECINVCLKQDPMRVVDTVIESMRTSFKPDAGLYVLAMAASFGVELKHDAAGYEQAVRVRQYALAAMTQVIHTPTHLYKFAEFVQAFRGWGPALTKAFANWYLNADVDRLAMHAWKYKSRDGWSHRDLLRLSHPKTANSTRNAVFKYMVTGEVTPDAVGQIHGAETLLRLGENEADEAAMLIREHGLTREAVPTVLQKNPVVWEALLENMPMTAMVRTLNRMTAAGVLDVFSDGEKRVIDQLRNEDAIRRSRIHPMQILMAARQYAAGRGQLGKLSWVPNQRIVDALDEAFYTAFVNVVPSNKKMLLAIDVSGSMSWATSYNMTVLEAAAAFSYVTYVTEPNVHMIGFCTKVRDLPIGKKMRLPELTDMLKSYCGGGTDTTLPVQYALSKKMNVDAIISFTDNETWANGGGWRESVSGYMDKYESKINPDVRFVNAAMVANRSTDVRPGKTNMLEICGLSSDTPAVISEFVRGNI